MGEVGKKFSEIPLQCCAGCSGRHTDARMAAKFECNREIRLLPRAE